jgi:hypothetical protein
VRLYLYVWGPYWFCSLAAWLIKIMQKRRGCLVK